LNRSTKGKNLLVILLSACMIVAGIFIGLQAFSSTPQFASLFFAGFRLNHSEQGTSEVTTLLADDSNSATQGAPTLNSSADQPLLREPIVIVHSDALQEQPATFDLTSQEIAPSTTQTATTTVISTALTITTSMTATTTQSSPTSVTITPTAVAPLTLLVTGPLPSHLENALAEKITIQYPAQLTGTESAPTEQIDLTINFDPQNAVATYQQLYAAATRFDNLDLDLSWEELGLLWRDADEKPDIAFDEIAVPAAMIAPLEALLGPAGSTVKELIADSEAVEVAWDEPNTLLLLPFDNLAPRLAVVAIDGQKPIENANRFDVASYPLIVPVYIHNLATPTTRADQVDEIIAQLPQTNRDPSRLTVLAMTGVTAMVRYTAKQMDELGNTWPAEIVGPELAAADITHISNEVPFVKDCETDIREGSLNFCSKHEYFETLQACGVDIIGLTGNHQNDYGRQAALDSLDFYQRAGLPVYGGGVDKKAAFAPLYYEHNGNRLAFLGANSYGPEFAWATDNEPGSAIFDLNIMSASIRSIHTRDLADLVFVELQYQERYDVSPLIEQRIDFNALVHAGADVVTGVQSHVPQSMEFTDGRLILFGLGNLFFDQMLRQDTREGMFVKHTIYDGRHISTQIFTTLLYDAGQPRWATDAEREALLTRVFSASYWE